MSDALLTDAGAGGPDLGWALALVLRRWHEEVGAVLDGIPHGPRGYSVLSAIVSLEPPTQAALAGHVQIDRTVMTYLLDDLEAAGLVQRVAAPHDRRIRRVVATAEGRRRIGECERAVSAAEQRVLAGLSPAAQQGFRAAATAAAQAIHRRSPDTDPCLAVEEVLSHEVGAPNVLQR